MIADERQETELMADFQQYYHIDLQELLDKGEVERVLDLASCLPLQSRTVKRIDPRAEWDAQSYLLALVVDNLSYLRYEQAGGKGHKPEMLERPKQKVPESHLEVSASELDALLFDTRS